MQYLNVYYTDVCSATAWLDGRFLIIYPVVSKILDAVTNVIMGIIIDRTHTKQGKLRPYILISAPLITLSGILLFAIPEMSVQGQMIWVLFSYNFYCSIAFTVPLPAVILMYYTTQGSASPECQSAISWCFLGFEAVAGIMLAVIVSQIKVEKYLSEITSGLMQRKKKLAEENSETWIDPIEAAKLEEKENKRLEEKARIEKLKRKCERKGLDFETENEKYLSKMARK